MSDSDDQRKELEFLRSNLRHTRQQLDTALTDKLGYIEKLAATITELESAQSEARFQKERAEGYSGWITEFEKREARLREALERCKKAFYNQIDLRLLPSTDYDKCAHKEIEMIRVALEGKGENE